VVDDGRKTKNREEQMINIISHSTAALAPWGTKIVNIWRPLTGEENGSRSLDFRVGETFHVHAPPTAESPRIPTRLEQPWLIFGNSSASSIMRCCMTCFG